MTVELEARGDANPAGVAYQIVMACRTDFGMLHRRDGTKSVILGLVPRIHPAACSERSGYANHAQLLDLHPRQQAPWNALHWRHQRTDPSRRAAWRRQGFRVHPSIWRTPARLV